MKRRLSHIAIAISCCLSCKEDQLNRNYPGVHTDPVSAVSELSVTFSGSFDNTRLSDITDHGFVWSNSKTLSLTTSESRHFGAPVSNKFQADITSRMPEGPVYVRAFVVSKTTTVYGNLQSFDPGKSQVGDFIVTEIKPKSGVAGDTLTIIGKGFSETLSRNKVNFIYENTTVSLKVAKVSSTKVKAVIPANIKFRTMTVELLTGTEGIRIPAGFEYKSAGIVSITPIPPVLCDTLTINWESYSQILSTVQINQVIVVPKKVTSTQIKVVLETLSDELSVQIETAAGYKDIKSVGFPASNLTVTSNFPGTFGIADTLSVSLNFPGCNTSLVVDGLGSFKRAGGTNQNQKYVANRYNDLPASFNIRMAFNDEKGSHTFYTSPTLLRKSLPWTSLKYPSALARKDAASFSINGKGYITGGIGLPGGNHLSDIWEYDPGSDQWTQRAAFPINAGNSPTAFVIGSKAYVLFLSTLHFWSYDPAADTWTQLPFFPGSNGTRSRFIAALGGKGYVAGVNGDLWEYDPVANAWSSKSSAPSISTQGSTYFTSGGKGILYTLDDATGYVTCHSYDPALNSWQTINTTFKTPFEHFSIYPLSFSSGTYLVDAFTGITMKVPGDLSKPWVFAGYAAIAQKGGGFAFVANEKGYMGLGQVTDQSLPFSSDNTVQFDPSKI